MKVVVAKWADDVLQQWMSALASIEEPRAEPFEERDAEGIARLVRSDLVPWVRSWPQEMQRSFRVLLEYGVGCDRSVFDRNSFGDPMRLDAEQVMLILAQELYGPGLVAGPCDEYRVIRDVGEQGLWQVQVLGERVKFPDPIPLWTWTHAAIAERHRKVLRWRSSVELFSTWEELTPNSEVDGVVGDHQVQARTALDVVREWVDAGSVGEWPLPAEGMTPHPLQELLLSEFYARFCRRERIASGPVSTPASPIVAVEDCIEGLWVAAVGLGLPGEGDLGEVAVLARSMEAGNESQFELYATWAALAEGFAHALADDLILRFGRIRKL